MNKLTVLKGKIHRATVTDANLNYEGSVSIDPELCKKAGIHHFEKVEIFNCNNGNRFSTYVIKGKPNEVCLNGAAARLVAPGDKVIIAAFVEITEQDIETHRPKLIFVNEQNQIKDISSPSCEF